MSLFWLGLLFVAYFLGWFAWVNQLQERLYGQAETIDRLNRRVDELESFKKSVVFPTAGDAVCVSDDKSIVRFGTPEQIEDWFPMCKGKTIDTTPPSTDL